MANTRGEISQQFVPSLPTQDKTDQTKTESLASSEKTGTVEERAKQLFQLLLDKVELQIDIQRRATNLAQNVQFTEEEIQTEINLGQKDRTDWIAGEARKRLMKLQPDTQPATDMVNAKIAEMTAQAGPEPNADEMRAAAITRLRQKKIKELKTFDYDPLQPAVAKALPIAAINSQLSAEQLMDLLIIVPIPETTTAPDVYSDPILMEDRRQLAAIDQRVKVLMGDPPVIEQYRQMSEHKLTVLRTVRRISRYEKKIEEATLAQEQIVRQAALRQKSLSPGEEYIIKTNQLAAAALQEKIVDLTSNPEVFILTRWRHLKEYQVELKRDHFVETPSRRALMDQIRQRWMIGQQVMATGPTGSGKTELLLQAARSLFRKEPRHASGHIQMTTYDLYGKYGMDGFEPGPFLQAIIDGVPFILDEINVVPNEILMRMKLDLNVKAGGTVTAQEQGNTIYPVAEGIAFGATANVKSEKHPDREKLDPALVRMFTPLPVDYLPPQELHDIMLASLMDERGGIQLSSRDDLDALANLCQAAAWVQRAYEGYEVDIGNNKKLLDRGGESTGKIATLREAVLDPGAALQMIAGWDSARLRDQTLREHINEAIVTFVKNENYPPEDRYHLVRIFALNGFLQGVDAESLGITGVSQPILNSWNGFQGQRIKPGDLYLSPEQVAARDPFNVLRRPDGTAADDLLGEDKMEQFAAETEGTAASNFAPGKQKNIGSVLSVPAAAALQLVEQQNPENTYGTVDSKTRFDVIPKKLFQALTLNPELLDTVVRKMNILITSQPLTEKERHAIPDEMSVMIQTLRTLIDQVTQAQNRQLLLQLGNMIVELGRSWPDYAKIDRPTWMFSSANTSIRVPFSEMIEKLNVYILAKSAEITS